MYEIETKVLEVDKDKIADKLRSLGAKEIENIRLIVDWYSLKEVVKNEEHPWYFRVRYNSNGSTEMTWKSLGVFQGNARHSKEINLKVDDFDKAKNLIESIGLVHYAHQEKDRHSFILNNWNFDIDTYPDMPTYLEIEGKSSDHIKEAIMLLGLENHTAISEGETKLIRDKYKLDWNNMKFD